MGHKTKLPMQPIIMDKHGVARFKANNIVRWLLDTGPMGLSKIALNPGFTREDREQFAQLIGYSVSGFGDLSYTSEETVTKADKIVRAIREDTDLDSPRRCQTCKHFQRCDGELRMAEFVSQLRDPYFKTAAQTVLAVMVAMCGAWREKEEGWINCRRQ